MTIQSRTIGIDAPVSQAVVGWLVAVAVLIVAIVLVGGATRLTDSGLSITEWKPLLGVIPPLSEADWHIAFAKYQQIPEYKQINVDMSLDDFKFIYWWEWAHRFLGRIIGLVFIIPFLWFLVRGHIPYRLRWPLLGLFALGGLQGVLGWYMVMSGLAERVDVSQYRLAAHLGLAVFIYVCIVWIVLRESNWRANDSASSVSHGGAMRLSALLLTGLIFVQIIAGAFVAGMRAGLSHNTWPLMDGAFIPDGLFLMSPWLTNFFENALTVQFNHRMLAYAIAVWTLLHTLAVFRGAGAGFLRRSAAWLLLSVIGQIALGIWTLVAAVPLSLGLLHQGGALIVLTFALAHLHALTVTDTGTVTDRAVAAA